MSTDRYSLAIHGGATSIARCEITDSMEAAIRADLAAALKAGEQVLQRGGAAIDAVVAAVVELENSPWFNAGRGSALNRDGICEMDAALMDGRTRAAGAVAGVRRVRNPILAARAVMERTSHVLLVGAEADRFAESAGLPLEAPGYFITERRSERLVAKQKTAGTPEGRPEEGDPKAAGSPFGTVGAVARDRSGNLAAATSTGGLDGKLPGRVGDSPLIGSGTYAHNGVCAVSGTGLGEAYIRAVAAHEVASMMRYAGLNVVEATRRVIEEKVAELGGSGGAIAVDADGQLAMPFTTDAMYRGWVRSGESAGTGIFR
ncbi:MAG: isoaspartyl peptidase/L-asparaginase [Verrucomicrobiales bacterium]|nr:isoaspartyl peptidase/L-asparaginase [Verrucomicrobiales bacterium]